MSSNKVQMIQVLNQELYVFGKLISRHPELPWLFSITDVYKACEIPLKREAKNYGKDPEVTYKSKQPNTWLAKNTKEPRIDAVAHEVRRRIKRYGIDCGFGTFESNPAIAGLLSNKDLCVKTVKGNTQLRGTYVAQDLVLSYAGFLNEKLQARINSTFISVLNGYTEEVTKKVEKNQERAIGTKVRQDNKDLNSELVEVCGRKHLLPMKVQQGVNEGVLGMSATKYKKLHGIKEPFNDNLTQEQIYIKNIGINIATYRIHMHKAPRIGQKEGNMIGLTSGQHALKVTAEYK